MCIHQRDDKEEGISDEVVGNMLLINWHSEVYRETDMIFSNVPCN